jgi:glucose/arabinose dehydrogenase
VGVTNLKRFLSRFIIFVIIVALAQAGLVAQVAAVPTLPPGFALKDMPSGQATQPLTDFAMLPDGSYFSTGKNGQVSWVSATGAAKTIANLPVMQIQDLGLTTLTLSQNYATSKQVYIARTMPSSGLQFGMTRVSAFTISGTPEPTALTNERAIFDLPAGSDVHATTGIVVAGDGTLWISVGDSSDFRVMDPQALRSLDVNQGYGKLLHIQPDGKGVANNPFYDTAAPSSWKSRVYASGFRSPFRFSLDPASGAPILGDVGWNTWEEVNLIRPGASYGWPCWEGDGPTASYRDLPGCAGTSSAKPLFTYIHGTMGSSITGGVVYTGSSYPAAYRGAYFFGDYGSKRLYTLTYNAQGQLTRAPEANGFGTDIGGPVKFGTAANGDIIYADIYTGTLKRLIYSAGNRAPVAQATTTTNAATRTVAFDGSGSTDLDGDSLTYKWDFGDGTTGTGINATHTYAAPGTTPLTAKLTVTDIQGAQGTTNITVVPANNAPNLTLTTPPAGTTYKVGDTVNLSAQATDPEDGNVSVRWQVVLVHCSAGYCHDHPGESSTGATFSRVFDDHGDDTRLEITAIASDHYGVTTRKKYTAIPRLRTLTINSNVPTAVTINGIARQTAQITAGAKVSLTAPQVASDNVATFDRWSDGAPATRQITMPDADQSLGVTYLTPIDRRHATDAALRTTLGAPTAPEAGDATLRYRDFALGRAYWTPRSGVHEVHGSILGTYLAQGGHIRYGEPTTDESTTPDQNGRYNHFYGTPETNATSIYWTPATGAQTVYGDIRQLWASMGWEASTHGYPKTSEQPTPNGRGRYNDFQNGGIYWLPGVGARSVHGSIYQKWAQYGWEGGVLGFPLTNETPTPDQIGRYNQFEGGSIYWHPNIGAFEIHGAIRQRWIALGWEQSYLGYPTSDELDIWGGKISRFQNGYITWNASNGQVIDARY